jgi:hypothetical protein
VRITADCPLIDPGVIDRVVAACRDCDYASNVIERTFPRGLDVEALPAAGGGGRGAGAPPGAPPRPPYQKKKI